MVEMTSNNLLDGLTLPCTSQDLCRAYGVRTTYKNASREAKRLIRLYDLPLRRGKHYTWVVA